MARSLDRPGRRAGKGLDALPMFLCRLIGRREPAADGLEAVRARLPGLQRRAVRPDLRPALRPAAPAAQPRRQGSLGALGTRTPRASSTTAPTPAVIFNTVCSFVTNTNLQHYSGEQHLSYFSQLGCIVWLMFVTPAAGLCVMLATLRGLRGDTHMGDFYLDLMRGLVFVFMPVALVIAVLLVASGVPMTFQPAAQATAVDGAATKMETQTIARGPVAALVAIKQAGTNGGGFFGPNSAHPFENPTPWSNLLVDRRDRDAADGLDRHGRADAPEHEARDR